MTKIGHNGINGDKLKNVVERIERLSNESAELAAMVKEVFIEAKNDGLDVKAIRKVLALRRKSDTVREQEQETVDLYMHALGMGRGLVQADEMTAALIP